MKRKYVKDPQAMHRVFSRISMATPFSTRERLILDLPLRLSFEALKTGQGTDTDFGDVERAICISVVRAHEARPDLEDDAVAGYLAMFRMKERHNTTGRWGFDGPALSTVNTALQIHEHFVQCSTPKQMIDAGRRLIQA